MTGGYYSKHASQSSSDTPFVRTYIYTCVYECSTYLNNCSTIIDFLVWFRVVWEIRLESYGPRDTSVILWYNIVYVYCKPIHTSLFGGQLRMTIKLTVYDCTTYQTIALLPKMHCFKRTKSYITTYNLLQSIASTHTLQCLSNYSGRYNYMYRNIKNNKKYYCT